MHVKLQHLQRWRLWEATLLWTELLWKQLHTCKLIQCHSSLTQHSSLWFDDHYLIRYITISVLFWLGFLSWCTFAFHNVPIMCPTHETSQDSLGWKFPFSVAAHWKKALPSVVLSSSPALSSYRPRSCSRLFSFFTYSAKVAWHPFCTKAVKC